jgi:hypothetical protein
MRKQIVRLNVDKPNNKVLFRAKQYEDLELHLVIEEHKDPFLLEEGERTELYIKQGEEIVQYSCDRVVGNDLFFKIDSNFLPTAGLIECELNIISIDGVMKLASFYGLIQASLSGQGGSLETYELLDSEGYILVDADGYILKVRR